MKTIRPLGVLLIALVLGLTAAAYAAHTAHHGKPPAQ